MKQSPNIEVNRPQTSEVVSTKMNISGHEASQKYFNLLQSCNLFFVLFAYFYQEYTARVTTGGDESFSDDSVDLFFSPCTVASFNAASK